MEEAIYHVHFVPDFAEGTVTPSAPQFGGTQGDRHAALVSFDVPETLRGEQYRYRIEGEDGAGGFVTTAMLPIDENGVVCTLLDEAFTSAGGQLLVRLAVSEMQNGVETAVARSFDGRLYFADAPQTGPTSPLRNSFSALVARAEQATAETERLKEELCGRVEEAEEQIEACGEEADALADAMETMNGRVTAAENDLSGVSANMEELASLLSGLQDTKEAAESEPTPWRWIQKLVRAGLAPKVFEVGDTLTAEHSEYGTLTWVVVDFDKDIREDGAPVHTMTLQTKTCLHLPNGAYDTKAFDGEKTGYSNGRSDWELSNIRAWLNSEEAGGNWYDGDSADAPAYAAQDGFARGFCESFLSAVGRVKKNISLNPSHSVRQGTTTERFFLPSRTEVFGSAAPGGFNINEGAVYAGYGSEYSDLNTSNNFADTNRVRTVNGEPTDWLLRSVHPSMQDKVAQVKADGSIDYVVAKTPAAVCPMCCIL